MTNDMRAVDEAAENWFMPTREISHDEAREIAQRLINSAFGNNDDRARFSIPTRVDHDDDCLIIGFIEQQRQIKADRERAMQDAILSRHERDGARQECDALAARVKVLKEALKPFVDYVTGNRGWIGDPNIAITTGSPLARRQLTLGDCLNAKAAFDTCLADTWAR